MTTDEKHHGLPGGHGTGHSWFYRMTAFQQRETLRQAACKRRKWPVLADGVWSKRPTLHYPHILPESHLEKNFYPPLYEPVFEYLERQDIAAHTELHNLKSSQACRFNFLYALRLWPESAPEILLSALPGVTKVSLVEFEYTGPDGATVWLGEPPGGKQGQNRTSVDAAIWWQDQERTRRLTLVEWKYTEAEFGGCGGYRSRGNGQRERCDDLSAQTIQPLTECYLSMGGSNRTRRRYWEHLAQGGISLTVFANNLGCPFRGPFYQQLRLFLLRAYCQEALDDVDVVDVVVMGFRDNARLLRTPAGLRHLGDNVIDVWDGLLDTAPPLRWVTVEEMIASLGNEPGRWREYLAERYGV